MRKAKENRQQKYWRLISQSLTSIYKFKAIHDCFKNQYFCFYQHGVGC
nr:MAG TPA: hypothetical protein [Caudoviricetes sp.]